jgi:hypothetical protein
VRRAEWRREVLLLHRKRFLFESCTLNFCLPLSSLSLSLLSIQYPAQNPNAPEVFYRVIAKNGNGPPVFMDDLLKTLKVPLLLLWGEKDPWIRPQVPATGSEGMISLCGEISMSRCLITNVYYFPCEMPHWCCHPVSDCIYSTSHIIICIFSLSLTLGR